MQLLFVLTIGALIGVVYPSPQCYLEKSEECNKKVFAELQDFSLCHLQPKIIGCIQESGTKCGNRFVSAADKIQSLLAKICEVGSHLNLEMEKHKDCLSSEAGTGGACVKDFVDVSELDTTKENVFKFQKKVCKNSDKIAECMLERAGKFCGNDAKKYAQIVYQPWMELQKGMCEEVIIPAGVREVISKRSESTQLPIFYGPLEYMF